MKENKGRYNRQIDKRIFDKDVTFLETTNLTPTLKTETSLEQIKNPSIKDSFLNTTEKKAKIENTYFQLLKKIEFLESNFQWMLERLKDTIKTHNKQYDQMLQKVQGIKKRDEQIEELIERQGQIFLALQQKITQLQQIIKHQEAKLMTTQSALNEARQHLEHIKNNR